MLFIKWAGTFFNMKCVPLCSLGNYSNNVLRLWSKGLHIKVHIVYKLKSLIKKTSFKGTGHYLLSGEGEGEEDFLGRGFTRFYESEAKTERCVCQIWNPFVFIL